jgi:CBS domain-containing protein
VILNLFILENINGVPVVDRRGRFVGIVTQQDLLFGRMSKRVDAWLPDREKGAGWRRTRKPVDTARDIMTSPAVCAAEDTDVHECARMMWKLHIHRLPIVRDGMVTGVVSSMDLCRMISQRTDLQNTAIA